jgi:hypothetical protein
MALRLRPSASDRRADALAFFGERECAGGGWNYGAPETLDEPKLSTRGVGALERLWRSEADGLLTLATATCALRLGHSGQATAAATAFDRYQGQAADTVTAAWAAFAAGHRGPWEAS